MDNTYDKLAKSLHTGFIDLKYPSIREYQPQLLTNDSGQGKKVLSTLHKELYECDEFWFSVAFVTKSGVATIMNALEDLEQRNVRGVILVSQYLNFTQPEALKTLSRFRNIELRIATKGEFHAKGYIFRKGTSFQVIIGSSNLTDGALSVNKEWNLKVSASIGSAIVNEAFVEFNKEWGKAIPVTPAFIEEYQKVYEAQRRFFASGSGKAFETEAAVVEPNKMQLEALKNLRALRSKGVQKALLISATGTGKTYLSAFDVQACNPKRFLFIVHRENIAKAALRTFQSIFGIKRTMGLYTGSEKGEHCAFLFCTIQTISSDRHLTSFEKDSFDYIVIDETHRAGAESYQKVLSHFTPKFLLGMTATPERTDGFDIFKQFDHNIAYEIRLNKALEEQMLSNFHYYGVTDVSVNGARIEDDAAFNLLVAEERVARIIERANFYSCDNGTVRGLVFCSSIKEAIALSEAFNRHGFNTVALSGESTEREREAAIIRLEHDDESQRLHYIFTVDIFNEGIDIPRVNQVIMLRPTQSAIVFVQQLGRGLRKTEGKDYLTVIDFIGNYSNNYLVPVALYGDTSYDKDRLRKFLTSGSSLIPGASTVNFDKVAKERIFSAIDSARLNTKKDLDREYDLLKFKIGHIPLMMDFVEHGARDPYQYVEYANSYYNYLAIKEGPVAFLLDAKARTILELLSLHVADSKRIEDVLVLRGIVARGSLSVSNFRNIVHEKYKIEVSDAVLDSCLKSLNFQFIKKPLKIIRLEAGILTADADLIEALNEPQFRAFLKDLLSCAEYTFASRYHIDRYYGGFQLYEKYSRKDVLRILNWDENMPGLNVGGYVVHAQETSCPLFITYKKKEDIADSIKYEDKFLSPYEFQMISKQSRTLKSREIVLMQSKPGFRLPLFIKKSDDEGNDFYYMGDVRPKADGFEQSSMPTAKGLKDIVKVTFLLNHPAEEFIYDYITAEDHRE